MHDTRMGRPQLLLVEDDDPNRDALIEILDVQGFEVTACSTAEQALDQLVATRFPLVLTDCHLPGESGGWLLREAFARGLLEPRRAVILTAHPSVAAPEGVPVLRKPFDYDALTTLLTRMVGAG
jgi:CheY-like chemotaxis protein